MLPATLATAWRHGVRLGFDCAGCCGNLMVVLLVLGVMDLRVMAVIGALITAERVNASTLRVREEVRP